MLSVALHLIGLATYTGKNKCSWLDSHTHFQESILLPRKAVILLPPTLTTTIFYHSCNEKR